MKNYPALKIYTSDRQYEALALIRDTKTIMGLITDGKSSRTLGSLLRSQWITEREYEAEGGVRTVGWFLTPEGENALRVYEVEQEIKEAMRKREQTCKDNFNEKFPAYADKLEELIELTDAYWALKKEVLSMRDELKETIYTLSWSDQNLTVNYAFNTCDNKTVRSRRDSRKYWDLT
jgi:DNA-binding PadR family transcriptional regulator